MARMLVAASLPFMVAFATNADVANLDQTPEPAAQAHASAAEATQKAAEAQKHADSLCSTQTPGTCAFAPCSEDRGPTDCMVFPPNGNPFDAVPNTKYTSWFKKYNPRNLWKDARCMCKKDFCVSHEDVHCDSNGENCFGGARDKCFPASPSQTAAVKKAAELRAAEEKLKNGGSAANPEQLQLQSKSTQHSRLVFGFASAFTAGMLATLLASWAASRRQWRSAMDMSESLLAA